MGVASAKLERCETKCGLFRDRGVRGECYTHRNQELSCYGGTHRSSAVDQGLSTLDTCAAPGKGESGTQHIPTIVSRAKKHDSGAAKSPNLCTATQPPGGCPAIVRPVSY